MLLGQPEEIALCALSTHSWLAATSFNPGTYTLLLRNAYVLTELLLLCIVFFCHTHLTHGCSTLIECGFKSYPTMQLPSTSWSCNISQSTPQDMYICFRQNRLSLTRYSVNHHYHRPCIPAGKGSAMSLREPLVSGEFLAHLARIFLEAFAHSSYLLCALQQFLFLIK